MAPTKASAAARPKAAATKAKAAVPNTIDEYIAAAPSEVRTILEKIRATIRKVAPKAAEKISYRIPTFTLEGRILIHFAAFKNHIGMYPPVRETPELIAATEPYRGEKGNLQFPLAQPIPYDLIRKIALTKAGNIKAVAKGKG